MPVKKTVLVAAIAVIIAVVVASAVTYFVAIAAIKPTTIVTTKTVPTTVVTVATPTTPATTTPAKPTIRKGVTIRVIGVQDPYWFPLKDLIPEFEKKYGIKVEYEGVSYYETRLRAISAFVAKSPEIDVVLVDQMWVAEYADAGWLVPLDDYIRRDKDEVNPTDFIPEVVHALSFWRGKIWTLPMAAYGQLVMYRKDVFDKLGLKHPPKSFKEDYDWWTWDKYLEYVKTIHGKTIDGVKFYGTVEVGQQPAPIVHKWTQYLIGMGGRWFETYPKAPWNFTPVIQEKGKPALELFLTLYKYSPPESIEYFWFDAGTRFGKGDIGILLWWTPYCYLIKQPEYMVPGKSAVVGKYDVALPPHPKGWKVGDHPIMSIGGWSYGISAFSKHKEEAWAFIKWATSYETQKKMGLLHDRKWGSYQFSDFVRYSLYKDPDLIKVYPWLPTQLEAWKVGNGKVSRPMIPIYFTLEGILGRYLNEAMAGKITVDDAFKHIVDEFTMVLKQNFYLPKYAGPSFNDTPEVVAKHLKELASG